MSSAPASVYERLRVLGIVRDFPVLAWAVTGRLHASGFEVTRCNTGAASRAAFWSPVRFDSVCSDMALGSHEVEADVLAAAAGARPRAVPVSGGPARVVVSRSPR